MNRIELMGRLVRDPEFFNEGTPRVNFTIAVDRKSTRDGDKADFFRCVAWDREKVKTASQIKEYFVKGKPIIIFGRMENEPFTDKDGRLRDSWGVKVNAWEFVLSDPTVAKAPTQHYENARPEPLPDSFEQLDEDNPF